MTTRFDRLPPEAGIFMQVWAQKFLEELEAALTGLEDVTGDTATLLALIIELNGLITTANTAIDDLNTATAATLAEQSLNTSRVANFTPPMIQADSAGNVTIANHDRIYGNGDVVPVTGGVVATGYANPDVARIYYVDPARAGGVVTYLFTQDEEDAAQTGDVHSVGAVEIPAVGTQDGGWVRPPGYVDPLL